MRQTPKRGEFYRDMDGIEYEILARARHTETYEELVVYIAADGAGKALACPLTDFMKKVDRSKYPNSKAEYCFEKVEADAEPGQQEETGKTEPLSQSQSVPAENNETQTDDGFSPDLMRFLDADGPEEKLDILEKIRTRLTNEMIDAIAISLDTEIREGEVQDRYTELREYLLMTIRFEGSRLRS